MTKERFIIEGSSDNSGRKQFFPRCIKAFSGIAFDLVLLVVTYFIVIKFVPFDAFSSGAPIGMIFSISFIIVILLAVVIFRNAIAYRKWCIFPPMKNNKETTSDTPGDHDRLNREQQIGRIMGTGALVFAFLGIVSESLGVWRYALAPPLSFGIFFWIGIIIISGFITCWILMIRFEEGTWSLIPQSTELYRALGDEGKLFIRLFIIWNGFCFLWVFVNLYFLYFGTPLIDANTYGMGLGVMVTGNVVIGVLLILSKYGN